MALTIGLVVLLMAINALSVAAEYSIVSARKSRIRVAAENGVRLAQALLPVLEHPVERDRYISGCQLGITVTSLALGALAEGELATAVLARIGSYGWVPGVAAHSVAVVLIVVVLSFVQVAFAEVLPKAIALQYPNRVALGTAPIVRVWLWVLAWPIRLFTLSSNLLLRVLRLPQPSQSRGHTYKPNEIQVLVDESRRGGVLEASTSQRLQRALELQDQPVRRLMVPRKDIFAVDLGLPVEAVVAAVMGCDYTRVPVFRGSVDEIVGSIHTKDMALRYVERGAVTAVDDLIRPVLHVPDTTAAERLLADMRGKSVAQAIVVDEFGGTLGLVTLEDLLTDVLGSVRQRRGETAVAEALADGRVRVPGSMRVDEAARALGVHWEGYANTVGGFVIERLGRVPERGEQFELDGLGIEVESVQRNLITGLRVRRAPAATRRAARDG